MINPKNRFQIGDRVVYVPEGVNAIVDGYLWKQSIGMLPEIVGYVLSIGVSVPMDSVVRALPS